MPATAPGHRALLIAGVVLIVLTGLIHAIEAPEYLEEETYIGVLFVLNVLGALASAVGMWRGSRAAWALGIVVAAGAFIAFILSRTVGLPSFSDPEWEPLGIVSLIVEGAFVLIAVRALTFGPREVRAVDSN